MGMRMNWLCFERSTGTESADRVVMGGSGHGLARTAAGAEWKDRFVSDLWGATGRWINRCS